MNRKKIGAVSLEYIMIVVLCIIVLVITISVLGQSLKDIFIGNADVISERMEETLAVDYSSLKNRVEMTHDQREAMVRAQTSGDATPIVYIKNIKQDALNTLKSDSFKANVSTSFTEVVPGAAISATVWHYPASFEDGATHLGTDFAVGRGTAIYAPSNGLVIASYNGCNNDGYIGDNCGMGNANGTINCGGNQLYFITSVNNKVYVITFSHMLAKSMNGISYPLAAGTIAYQGDILGYVGSSGNSSGPHCHVEMFYLGEGNFDDIVDNYLKTTYSPSFGCGWGDAGLNHRCDYGASAPCRLDPSKYLS